MLRVPVHKRVRLPCEPAHIWATAGPRVPEVCSGVFCALSAPPWMGHYFARDHFRCVSSPCRATAVFSRGVSPKPAAPAPPARARGTEVSLLTALPPNVSTAVSRDTVYPTPAKCAGLLGIKHVAGVNPFPTGEGITNGFEMEYLDQKNAQGAQSGLWWSDKRAKAQTVASGSGPNLAPG